MMRSIGFARVLCAARDTFLVPPRETRESHRASQPLCPRRCASGSSYARHQLRATTEFHRSSNLSAVRLASRTNPNLYTRSARLTLRIVRAEFETSAIQTLCLWNQYAGQEIH